VIDIDMSRDSSSFRVVGNFSWRHYDVTYTSK